MWYMIVLLSVYSLRFFFFLFVVIRSKYFFSNTINLLFWQGISFVHYEADCNKLLINFKIKSHSSSDFPLQSCNETQVF